jgi:hypothetical protein
MKTEKTNSRICYEWLKGNVDEETASYYYDNADVDRVNSGALDFSIEMALYWDTEHKGFEFWDGINDKWHDYLKGEDERVNPHDNITPAHYNKDKNHDVYSFCHHNDLGLLEGNCIKYVSRYKKKNGKEDLLKAIETLNRLIELNYGEGRKDD